MFDLARLKRQTGIRIDRILFEQFRELCRNEKLRPGEGVERLVRLAVEAGRITSLDSDRESSGRLVDEALFRSRLARLKTSLGLEERHLKETGGEMEYKESEHLTEELAELARRSVNPELVKEFEKCLSDADRLYEEAEKNFVEREINETKSGETIRQLVRDKTSLG